MGVESVSRDSPTPTMIRATAIYIPHAHVRKFVQWLFELIFKNLSCPVACPVAF